MLAFISCAKTMASRSSLRVPEVTTPRFADEALRHALSLAQYSASELEGMLRVNAKIAVENCLRYHDFCSEYNRPMPAIGAYTGAVFKRIAPKDFTSEDFLFAQEHLRITSQGGVLLNLASAEMKDLFDWKRVAREVRVITPEFQVRKGEKLVTVVVYAKMCRGEMTRFFIKNRITRPEELKGFEWEGFAFDEERSTKDHWWFIA